jgi:hypothetical protein
MSSHTPVEDQFLVCKNSIQKTKLSNIVILRIITLHFQHKKRGNRIPLRNILSNIEDYFSLFDCLLKAWRVWRWSAQRMIELHERRQDKKMLWLQLESNSNRNWFGSEQRGTNMTHSVHVGGQEWADERQQREADILIAPWPMKHHASQLSPEAQVDKISGHGRNR